MIKIKCWITIWLLFAASPVILAQEAVDTHTDEVQSLVSFYKYMLNTVGGNKASTRDKEVIITESYKKAFLNGAVQVEDDLLPDRNAITNKDISAYLRDVDFFFKDIKFEFDEIEITPDERDNGKPYYLVSFVSKIQATTLEGEPYQKSAKRFIEVNLNPESSDLKIVSVYTTKISRDKELRIWWESLSFEWTRIFKEIVPFDSINSAVLLKISAIDSLNLENNQFIRSVKPLSALNRLVYLNISNTKIEDLRPLRYSPRLKILNVSNSPIQDVSVIQYFDQLKTLDLTKTNVRSIDVLADKNIEDLSLSGTQVVVFNGLSGMKSLKSLNLSNTTFSNIQALSNSIELEWLDVSRTGVTSVNSLRSCSKLTFLDVSETYITNLQGLEQMQALREVHLNQTRVESLQPLTGLKSLKKVYADYTGVNERISSAFMASNRGVLVITNSEKIMEWWSGLGGGWKTTFTKYVPFKPTREDLVKLINRDSLDLSDHRLVDGAPLSKFTKLRYLDISGNLITNWSFTQSMEELEYLKAVKLPVTTTAGLEVNRNLKYVILTESIVKDVRSLESLSKLELLDVEATAVSELAVKELLSVNPNVVVIYQPNELLTWWNELPLEWQEVFEMPKIDSYHLHQLIEQRELTIQNVGVSSLSPLNVFINLHKIVLDKTRVESLSELSHHDYLEEIICRNGPLMSLESIEDHYGLRVLDVSNTAVKDLRPLSNNRSLSFLNCSGTNIKNLKGLEELYGLNYLDISNTRVWRMDRLYDIRNLNTLICYNTRIRSRTMDEYKSSFPDCEITYY